MLKLIGSLLIAFSGALAWYLQRSERKRRRDVRSDFQMAFRRMGEEVRIARTPLPALLNTLAKDCGPEAVAFFSAVSKAAGEAEDLSGIWRKQAEALSLDERDRSAVIELGKELQGDEEKACKGISHVVYTLTKSAEAAEENRTEEEKRAAALWFSASALLVILLI